jgi:hypothetical protein
MVENILSNPHTILVTYAKEDAMSMPKIVYNFHENEDAYVFTCRDHDKDDDMHHSYCDAGTYSKFNWMAVKKSENILLYELREKMFHTHEGYILDKYIFQYMQNFTCTLHPIHYIYLNDPQYKYTHEGKTQYYQMCFVFNMQDMRKIYAEACNKLREYLPFDMVSHIMSFLNFKKKEDTEYTVDDFPLEIYQEFKGKIPKFLSKFQIKELYIIGAIKLAVLSLTGVKLEISDEAYDYVYPENQFRNIPNIHSFFESKEQMNIVKEGFLNDFFGEL